MEIKVLKMILVCCSVLCYICLTNWPASTASMMLYFSQGWLVDAIKMGFWLCWVLGLGAGASSPADTACAIFWLLPFLSKDVAAGSCPGLGVKKNTCSGRGLRACCVSAPSLKGSRWVWIAGGPDRQEGAAQTAIFVCLDLSQRL